MRRARLPWRIVASAVVSVVLAVGLLVLGVFLARPTIRDATVQSLMSTVDLEECAASPETWGARAGTLTIHAYAPDGLGLIDLSIAAQMGSLADRLKIDAKAH